MRSSIARRMLVMAAGVSVLLAAGGVTHAQGPAMAQTSILGPARSLTPILSPEQREIYTKAFAAIEAGRWAEARLIAGRGRHPLADKLIRWLEYQLPRSGAAFEDIASFLDANPDWPAQDQLMRRAEEALVDQTNDSVVLAWFALRGPLTADGAMRYIEALLRNKERDKALALIRSTWASGGFGTKQEKTFLARYRQYLGRDDHVERLDRLLWDGRREEARRIMPLVDSDMRALAEARMRLAAMSGGVDGALRKVPQNLLNHPGLLFERMKWRRRKGQEEGAREMLAQAPADLGRPDIWWNERAILARRSIAAGKMAEAYKVANNHRLNGSHGANYAEAEFLAGWIALRFLKQPKTALPHFTGLYEAARFPVTRARGAYWAGRALEEAGDKKRSVEWYQRAAALPITYYGHVARARLDPASRPAWPAPTEITPADREAFERSEITRAARLLAEVRERDRIKPFILRQVANAKTPGQHALAGELSLQLERPDLAVSAAKRSAQIAGVMLPEQGWPLIHLPRGERPEPALILATIRQESAFESDAVSRAGARGLMQLMPATARSVARGIGASQEHADHRLLNDPHYNIRLGQSYLAGLIDDFDGSYLLALAAYNAGPGRARQWIRDNGDPRRPGVDPIDWIEMIPFEETRNYVQRVFENLQIYRQRLGRTLVAQDIDQDLRRRN
ncbi:MAG: lytic transglycosylase domain-containing protein [Rhodospirillales bacterium]|nr:lytic transglycosylase domain-containing protein [Rhodospirillales bacterium]